jgi:hypothetical protein
MCLTLIQAAAVQRITSAVWEIAPLRLESRTVKPVALIHTYARLPLATAVANLTIVAGTIAAMPLLA